MTEPFRHFSPLDLTRIANLVRPFETFAPRAILRPTGGWTIGYGHTKTARAGSEVTQDEAEALLLYDLDDLAKSVRAAIYAPVTRNQMEALVAFAFNIGLDNFLASSTLRLLNAGDPLGAAQEIERWRRADVLGEDQVVDALVRRRAAEKARFLTPPQGFPKASSAVMRPHFDEAFALTVEAAPADIASSPEGSASLAAAESVAIRLRALVPDAEPQAEPPHHQDDAQPALLTQPAPAPAIAPYVEAERETGKLSAPIFSPNAAELAGLAAVSTALATRPLVHSQMGPETEPHDHTVIGPNDPFVSADHLPPRSEAAPATPSRVHSLVEDPFAPPPPFEMVEPVKPGYEPAPPPRSFEAPVYEPVPNQTTFGAASSRRTYTAPVGAQRADPSNVFWLTFGKGMLIVLALIGLALFGYSISLMLKAEPTLYSFGLGVAGVLAMIPAGYALLGVPSRSRD